MNIEKCLITHGATDIAKTYEDGKTKGIKFAMLVNGKSMVFSLPARIENCERVLEGMTTSRTRSETLAKIPAQAERTAWKIVLDWIEAQMAMVDLAQIEMAEVFLAYVFNPETNQTYFEMIKEGGFKKLLPGGSS